jgi:uncharacterized protein (DUF362 family)/Pyruvate/2-oxoacid:ferredoxin oxidoreductase delta subunit
MNCDVSISRCESYEPEVVKAGLLAALVPIGGLDWVTPGMKIALKVNMMMQIKPEKAGTVHPQIATALCELLVERGASVVVGDSPGGPFSAAFLAGVYSTTGMRQVLKSGAVLNDNFAIQDVSYPEAVSAKEFQVTSYIAEADAVIGLCKMKTHALMAYTGACKNLFGIIPGLRKSEFHYRYNTHEAFANMLVDLCEWCKPRLSIADAIMTMEGNGPSGGTPRFMGAILASFNPHALDLAGAHLMNLTANDVPTLAAAVSRGLVPQEIGDLRVFGDLESFVIPDYQLTPKQDVTLWGSKNPTIAKLLSGMFASRPLIDHPRCVGCGECFRVCPAGAITIANKKASIDKQKCIRCFCCQEFCPHAVIEVHRPPVARLLNRK